MNTYQLHISRHALNQLKDQRKEAINQTNALNTLSSEFLGMETKAHRAELLRLYSQIEELDEMIEAIEREERAPISMPAMAFTL